MRIGLTEFILIVVVVLALFKPEKLKEYSRTFGEAIKTIKKEKEKMEDEIVKPVKESVDSVKEPINEIVQPITELKNDVNIK